MFSLKRWFTKRNGYRTLVLMKIKNDKESFMLVVEDAAGRWQYFPIKEKDFYGLIDKYRAWYYPYYPEESFKSYTVGSYIVKVVFTFYSEVL